MVERTRFATWASFVSRLKRLGLLLTTVIQFVGWEGNIPFAGDCRLETKGEEEFCAGGTWTRQEARNSACQRKVLDALEPFRT